MDNRMLIATRKGLFQLHRAGNFWSIDHASFLGDNVSMVTVDPRDGVIYAGLDHGHFGCKLQKSSDDGRTWEEITAPAYPEGEMIEPSEMNFAKQPKPAALRLIWMIEPGSRNQPGRLWIGTLPGGLFRSDDHGNSWELMRSLWDREERKEWFGGGYDDPGIHSMVLDPRDDQRITLGVSCGGVWQSGDDGNSWELLGEGLQAEYMPPDRQGDPTIQDPHLIVGCPADSDRMWTQHHNGIFHSSDGARTWTQCTDVSPSHFGFAVAVHPKDGDTAWFAPAIKDEKRIPVDGKLVITRTRDGGKTFETLSNGLPQEHAYDIVFRHCLAVDDTGDALAFGTTTGSVFTSDNGGDSWQCVATHLPPVYAVKFG